jgi:phosphoglucomutase
MKRGDVTQFFDINKITDFVFGNPNDRTNEVEIVEKFTYDNETKLMVPNSREVKEVKVNDYTGQNTIRYDMVKMFIDILDSIEDMNVLTLGQSLTVNTMEAYGLIREAKDE